MASADSMACKRKGGSFVNGEDEGPKRARREVDEHKISQHSTRDASPEVEAAPLAVHHATPTLSVAPVAAPDRELTSTSNSANPSFSESSSNDVNHAVIALRSLDRASNAVAPSVRALSGVSNTSELAQWSSVPLHQPNSQSLHPPPFAMARHDTIDAAATAASWSSTVPLSQQELWHEMSRLRHQIQSNHGTDQARSHAQSMLALPYQGASWNMGPMNAHGNATTWHGALSRPSPPLLGYGALNPPSQPLYGGAMAGMGAHLLASSLHSTSGYPSLSAASASPYRGAVAAGPSQESERLLFQNMPLQPTYPVPPTYQMPQTAHPTFGPSPHAAPTTGSLGSHNALLTQLLASHQGSPSLLQCLSPEQQLAALQSFQMSASTPIAAPASHALLAAPAPARDAWIGSNTSTTPRVVPGDATTPHTVPMETDTDQEQLSRYQVLVRRQLEYFVSQQDDAEYSVQGRKKQARLGQVGIRCKHCSHLPHRMRGRGAGYYPAKLAGVYQAAQNMATNHLNQFCTCIPADLRETLRSLRGSRHDSSVGGGKQYWADACVVIGLKEVDNELRFRGDGPSA